MSFWSDTGARKPCHQFLRGERDPFVLLELRLGAVILENFRGKQVVASEGQQPKTSLCVRDSVMTVFSASFWFLILFCWTMIMNIFVLPSWEREVVSSLVPNNEPGIKIQQEKPLGWMKRAVFCPRCWIEKIIWMQALLLLVS